MTQQIDESVLRKIQKALALSKDNSNENEAQTAMLAAQRLMAKHNVSMKEVDTHDLYNAEKPKNVISSKVRLTRIEWFDKQLGDIIGDNFRCYFTWQTGYAVCFLGLEEDAEIAKEVYSFARNALKFCTERFMRTRNVSGKRSQEIKKNYMVGFLSGLRAAFKEQVAKESFAIALVKDEIVVSTHKKMKIKKEDTGIDLNLQNMYAQMAGYEDGRTLDQRRKRLE